jgi:membrane-bound metal-dependent hydrolase YbcI (DUF457 family)
VATATAPSYRTIHTVRTLDRSGEHAGDMEGSTHAGSGFLVGLGLGVATSGLHAKGVQVPEHLAHDVLYGVLAAGFALLPDADHPKATFAYSAGALSHGTSHLVATAFGGHRQGFHSLFGIGFMALVTASCTLWWANRWALAGFALFAAVCVVAGLKATGFLTHGGRRGHRYHGGALRRALVGSGTAALAVTYARPDLWWLVAVGMALHILEDEFTGHGCALLWPISNKRYGGDGRQPARRRTSGGSRGPRKPKSEYRRRLEQSQRLPAGGPPPRPRRPASKPTCPKCWVGKCPECTDSACGCPERGADVHQLRPKRRAKVPVDTAPALPAPEDDIPPF